MISSAATFCNCVGLSLPSNGSVHCLIEWFFLLPLPSDFLFPDVSGSNGVALCTVLKCFIRFVVLRALSWKIGPGKLVPLDQFWIQKLVRLDQIKSTKTGLAGPLLVTKIGPT